MRTPVVLLVGQEHTATIAAALMERPGTAVISDHFDGQVVRRKVSMLLLRADQACDQILEVANACVMSTIHSDLLVLLRRVHRRDDVDRIVLPIWPQRRAHSQRSRARVRRVQAPARAPLMRTKGAIAPTPAAAA